MLTNEPYCKVLPSYNKQMSPIRWNGPYTVYIYIFFFFRIKIIMSVLIKHGYPVRVCALFVYPFQMAASVTLCCVPFLLQETGVLWLLVMGLDYIPHLTKCQPALDGKTYPAKNASQTISCTSLYYMDIDMAE